MSFENYGKYQLIKKLATGGMAEIWLARQQGLEGFEKLMVVKRILPHLAENDEFINMFLDEARIAARLNHPNIVQIFDLGAEGDTFFIAMEFIHGEDVRRVWKRADAAGKPIPVPLVCRIIMDACAGLDYAHKKLDQAGRPLNIVHRDISPQNILATFEGGVKVVDFGIAKAADQATVTRSGVLKGKYSYMSPEQAAGKKIDHRTDVFALGVVLYELLTGTRLFKRGNDIATLNAVSECAVALPSEVNARLPKDLDPVVMKALAKDLDARYQDAAGLQAALEDWLLQNKLPSGSGHLASFMQDIYAERLAREAEEGKFLLDDLEASRNRSSEEEVPRGGGKATPVSKPGSPRPTASLRAQSVAAAPRSASGPGVPAPPVDPEATLAAPELAPAAPPRPRSKSSSSLNKAARIPDGKEPKLELKPRTSTRVPPARTPDADAAGGTVSQTIRRGKAVPALVAAGSVLVGLGIAGAIFLASGKAEVTVESEPPGASVRLGGQVLQGCLTPCPLPQKPPGRYDVVLSLAGYKDKEAVVEVPRSGRPQSVFVRLDPLDKPIRPTDRPKDPVVDNSQSADAGPALVEAPAADAGAAVRPPPSKVLATLSSEPPGAKATVDGRPAGNTPVQLELEANSRLNVLLELPGYRDLKDSVFVGSGAKFERTFALKKEKEKDRTPVAANGTGGSGGRKDPDPGPANPQPPPVKNTGLVRFVVKPWATVVCGNASGSTLKLGDTPFADKQMPVGSYTCTFTNPELGIRKQDVMVVANERATVVVEFPKSE